MASDYTRYRDEFDGTIKLILELEDTEMSLLVLSEAATKELWLAIRDSKAQVDTGEFYTADIDGEEKSAGTHYLHALQIQLMDHFEFERGSLLLLWRFTFQVCRRSLDRTISHNPAIRSEMVDVLAKVDSSKLT